MAVEQLLIVSESEEIINGTSKLVETKPGAKSPVYLVTETYIREGMEAMRKLDRKYENNDADVTLEGFLKKLTPEDHSSFALNYAGVIMGIVLQTAERVIVEKALNADDVYTDFNNAVIGTPFSLVKTGDEEDEPISDEAWNKMLEVVIKKDRTFGAFFEEDYETLPKSLRTVIKTSYVKETVVKYILPAYREQVGKLIKGSKQIESKAL